MKSIRPFFVIPLFAISLPALADDSTQVPLAQAPPSVQHTIAAQIGGGTLGGIYKSGEGADTAYDVDFTTKSGDADGFTVGADGSLLSTEVALNETPPAVQKTIQAEAAGWQLDEIDKSTEDGGTTYDVDVSKGPQTQDFTVDDDGTVLSVGIPPAEAPNAILSAIQSRAAGGQIESIDKNLDDTTITYDVDVSVNGATRTFTVAQDGTVTSAEIALADAPPVVQATITQQLAGGALKSIYQNSDADDTTFDVDVLQKNGVTRSFTVGIGGSVRTVAVTLDQVPPPARQTIKDQIGAGKILEIDQSLLEKKEKVLPYEVAGRKDGKPFNFSVGPKGRFLGMDD